MCYKVFGTKKGKGQTFMEAKKSCENIESTLVSITDPYEQGKPVEFVNDYKIEDHSWKNSNKRRITLS